MQNFRLSIGHVKFYQVCTLIGSLKYKLLAKKYRGVISHDPEDWCKIWRKTSLLFKKCQEFGEIWPEHSKVYKTCIFICSYCAKYLMFDLKRYRGVIFDDTERWCIINPWKLTHGLENDMRKMANFHQSTWKSRNSDFDEIL